MFAGIVESTGVVAAVRPIAAGARLELDLGGVADGLALGASVAVSGVCLTLAELRGGRGAFEVIPETLRRTSLGSLRPGDRVNLERSLRVGDPVDGHFVQGHVDGVGAVRRIDKPCGEHVLWIHGDDDLRPYLIRKGSIAIDGVSLTVAAVADDAFSVALIPTTLERTTLGRVRVGDRVNIETDVLARIAVARLDSLLDNASHAAGSGLALAGEGGKQP